jgi:hypothetical protein
MDRNFILNLYSVIDHPPLVVDSTAKEVIVEKGEYDVGEVYQLKNTPHVKYGCYEHTPKGYVFLKLHDLFNIPICGISEPVNISSGDIDNYNAKTPLKTSWGIYLLNQVSFCSLFGDKFEYAQKFDNKMLTKLISTNFLDKKISAEEVHKIFDHIVFVGNLSELCVATYSRKALTSHPDIKKRKAELLEKYKDDMTPENIVKIEKELIDLDKQWIKGDTSANYYACNKKAYGITRKKMHSMVGAVEVATEDGTEIKLMSKALEDGWGIEDIPIIATDLRHGSYSRGKETAKGGEDTKNIMRVFQSIKIIEDDCGTKYGAMRTIGKEFIHEYYGRYVYLGNKEYVIDETNADMLANKLLKVRTPGHCLTENGNLCHKCCGAIFKKLQRTVIGLLAIEIGSTFLSAAMASMHGKEGDLLDISDISMFLK